MGYSHYWSQAGTIETMPWSILCSMVEAICKEAGGQGIKIDLEFSDEHLCVNGREPEDFADFWIDREGRKDFCHCKTGERPYDTVVVAICCVLEQFMAGKMFRVWSDGGPDDWQEGLALALMALQPVAHLLKVPAKVIDNRLPATLDGIEAA